MNNLSAIKAEATSHIAEVDAAIAGAADENEKRLLNQLRSGLELTQAAAEALQSLTANHP